MGSMHDVLQPRQGAPGAHIDGDVHSLDGAALRETPCGLCRAHQAPAARNSPAGSPASPLRTSQAEASAADGVLRLVSGGQDCEVALWDFSTVSEDSMVLRSVQERSHLIVRHSCC